MTENEMSDTKMSYYSKMSEHLANMTLYTPPSTNLQAHWSSMVEPSARITTWDTGMPLPLLQFIGVQSVAMLRELRLHSHILKMHAQVIYLLTYFIYAPPFFPMGTQGNLYCSFPPPFIITTTTLLGRLA